MTIAIDQRYEYGKSLNRVWLSLPVAALITVFLFLMMRLMILTEYSIPPVEAFTIPSINPIIKDREILKREALPARTKQIDLPPPRPKLATENAQQPSEAVAPLVLPVLTVPAIQTRDFARAITDRDAQPIMRFEPVYPARALDQERTGYCKAVFAVSKTGKPQDINASCSEAVFEKAVVRAVRKWKYNPRVVEGVPVMLQGVVATFTFEITE